MFDYESPKAKEPVDYTGLKIAAMTAPLFFLITFLYNADAGLAACIVLDVIIFAVKIRWHLRKHIWFWAIIAVIFALHVPLVFMVQWPKNAPTIFYAMPIGIADFLIISGALKFAENLMSNSSPSNDENE
jgi:magnesium-transporting ATPase (P-type)